MDLTKAPLELDSVYHVYNRAVGKDKLFINNVDYYNFIFKLRSYILPFIDLYAYCLIPNHFHLLLHTKDEKVYSRILYVSDYEKQVILNRLELIKQIGRAFSNFFNSYAKTFNLIHNRSGKLFELPYRRIRVDDERYFSLLIRYIHFNPVHHGVSNDIESWKFSSYHDLILGRKSIVDSDFVLKCFGNLNAFLEYHNNLTGQY
jgi:REP element-mobilizing transposase RayT